MIIDAHTHIFPDRIAPGVIRTLEAKLPDGRAWTDGTLSGLTASMKRSGVDYSVVLPVVTAPKQFDSINQFAAAINGTNGIISFGGIHPDCEDITGKLEAIKALGLLGIKLHPNYQGVYIDDDRYIRIIRECIRLDLMVSIHAGVDIGIPDPIYCPPVRAAHMLDKVYGRREPSRPHIILAHIGGHDMWDEVRRCLVGRNVYLDLSYSLDRIQVIPLLQIIQDHGADRILFGTDSPWGDQQHFLQYFNELPLFDDEKEHILWRNSAEFLKLNMC